jgi:thioredoxin-like negative regulator of GroEL
VSASGAKNLRADNKADSFRANSDQFFTMKRTYFIGLLALGLTLFHAARANSALTDIEQALKLAQAQHQPLLIEFTANWCGPCHVMDATVLNGSDWDKRQNRFVLARTDVDSTYGDTWMQKLKIEGLPTYIVLNPDGSERGRLSGASTRDKFYPALDRLLSGDGLSTIKKDAARGSIKAIIQVMQEYDDNNKVQDGLRWYTSLPEHSRKAVQANPEASAQFAVFQMKGDFIAANSGKSTLSASERDRLYEACRIHATQALKGPISTSYYFGISSVLLSCARNLPEAQRKALAKSQVPVLESLYDKDLPTVQTQSGDRLVERADNLAEYYDVLGDATAKRAIYERGIAIARKRLDDGHGGIDVKRDGKMASDLIELLNSSGRISEHTAMLKLMADSYPDAFEQQYEYGVDLLEHGKAQLALPYLVRASNIAPASHKLSTTFERAKALVALNRRSEAVTLFNDAVSQCKAQFPGSKNCNIETMKL